MSVYISLLFLLFCPLPTYQHISLLPPESYRYQVKKSLTNWDLWNTRKHDSLLMMWFWGLWQEMESSMWGAEGTLSFQALARLLNSQVCSLLLLLLLFLEISWPRYGAVPLGQLCQVQWESHAHTSLPTPPPQPAVTAHGGAQWIPVWAGIESMLPEPRVHKGVCRKVGAKWASAPWW